PICAFGISDLRCRNRPIRDFRCRRTLGEPSMISTSEHQTYTFAKDLAAGLQPPAHILLYGDLGAGKTLFAKGLAEGFGVDDIDDVTSPTFTLINHYS